jgi:hypothetical protein
MRIALQHSDRRVGERAVLLLEAVIAVALSAAMSGGILYGFVQTSRKLAWATYSSSAEALAAGRLECGFSCKWDPSSGVDEMSNLKLVLTNATVVTSSTSSCVSFIENNLTVVTSLATNYFSYSEVTNLDSRYRYMKSDCVWTLRGKTYTNTVCVLRAPNY